MIKNILSPDEFTSEKLEMENAHARGILSTTEYLAFLAEWSQDSNENWINEGAILDSLANYYTREADEAAEDEDDGMLLAPWGNDALLFLPAGEREEYLTIEEVAARLKVKPKTIRNKMASGILLKGSHFFSPPGLGPRFKWSAVERWIEGVPVSAETSSDEGIPMARGYVVKEVVNGLQG
jgi:hypothetical protein